MKRALALLIPLVPALWLAGCSDPARAPAEAALRTADGELRGLTAEVVRFAPAQAKAAQAAGATARALADRRDWKGALEAASGVPQAVKEAVAAAALARAELARAWALAGQDVPNLLYAIEDRLDELGEAKALPAGLSRESVAAARAELGALQAAWAAVPPLVKPDDPAEGVARAHDLADRARALLARLNLR